MNQLKNYILTDLKQKSVPGFETGKGEVNIEADENDNIMNELERQLEMERNLHIAQ